MRQRPFGGAVGDEPAVGEATHGRRDVHDGAAAGFEHVRHRGARKRERRRDVEMKGLFDHGRAGVEERPGR